MEHLTDEQLLKTFKEWKDFMRDNPNTSADLTGLFKIQEECFMRDLIKTSDFIKVGFMSNKKLTYNGKEIESGEIFID